MVALQHIASYLTTLAHRKSANKNGKGFSEKLKWQDLERMVRVIAEIKFSALRARKI
ncbi:hypothetical protein [Burkholderia gladioli]|uniref:hypothetical protein n=1 Tax=Burkholderia gladioli TaxID=28095 RepID=UPI0012FE2D46|nr:hypothetical protein [Burkholderia gladioli]